jgi:hypothetical protein
MFHPRRTALSGATQVSRNARSEASGRLSRAVVVGAGSEPNLVVRRAQVAKDVEGANLVALVGRKWRAMGEEQDFRHIRFAFPPFDVSANLPGRQSGRRPDLPGRWVRTCAG